MAKRAVEYRGELDPAAVADYLEALALGFRQGLLTLKGRRKAMELPVAGEINLEMEARLSGKSKAGLELSLGWRLPKRPAEEAPGLPVVAPEAQDMPPEPPPEGVE